MPGPYLPDLVRELRVARDQIDHATLIVDLVLPPLGEQLCDVLGHHLAKALQEIDEELATVPDTDFGLL